MWKHSCAFVCALAALLLANPSVIVKAQDPSTQPLLQFADLLYGGAFRLPDSTQNGDTFNIGGRPVTFNPARKSLIVGSRLGRVAEVSIPSPVISSNVSALPFAAFLQGFYEPTEGQLSQIPGDPAIDSILVYGDRLYGSASIYYDANNEQRYSHYSRSLNLGQLSFRGWSSLWQVDKTGFVSGFMALVPSEWQERLGGPAITGQCCLPIAYRTSWGPSAFAFDPADVGLSNVGATPLLYYDSAHPTLGPWSGSNPTYGATTQIAGVALIAGTRTALYFGRNGLGEYCYGNGTGDQSLHGTIGPDGAKYCYDPTSGDKGQHAYPYRYQIWAYDLNDFAAVKAGQKAPWAVVPYGVWPFDLPTKEPSIKLGGIGYDSQSQTIYVSQLRADPDGYDNRPLIHVLRIGGVSGSPLPVPDLSTAPTVSSKATAVALTANKTAPQAPGTSITWTATPTGGVTPHQYKWWLYNGSTWTALTTWIASNTYTWTPSSSNAGYKIAVWVRSAGNSQDAAETSTTVDFPIGSTSTSSKVTSVGMTADKAAPQAPGTTITFSAVPVGGVAPHQYKWWIYDGSTWKVSGTWTTSSTFNWTPSTANSSYKISVWVRSAGKTADAEEAKVTMSFPISGTATSSPPPPADSPTTDAPTTDSPTTDSPPPTTSSKVSYVSLAASKASPQPPATTITFTASPVGGVTPHQYKWWIYNGSTWSVAVNWTTSNNFNWTPATANANYKISVWVRSAGKTSDVEEAKATLLFPISSTQAPSTSTPPTTNTRASAVTLVANKVAPQAKGTSITFTATPTGGVAPHSYKFYVWDGSTWLVVRGWSTSNTFTWTPQMANAYYKVAVWVKSYGNNSDDYEASTSIPFAIK